MIEKIVGLNGMKNLKILSLARNSIKTLNGIETLSETLEQLWISYNLIDKVKGIESLKKLKVLYIGNNLIKDWNEFNKFYVLPLLEDLLFAGNPLVESLDEIFYKADAARRIPQLKKLDGETIIRDEVED